MRFALITEGPSEHRIIKHIIFKYFKERNPEVNQIQPKIINNKQDTPGGWNEVLKYCEREELKDILIENDFLIIQIDTDQSQTKPFSVSHTQKDNKQKSIEDLYSDVIEKIKELIKPEILEANSDKFFFAICVHTIECWLLPIFYADNHKNKTGNCLDPLNTAFRKKGIRIVTRSNKNESNGIRSYEAALKNWTKKKDIINAALHNIAFKKFIDSLEEIKLPQI